MTMAMTGNPPLSAAAVNTAVNTELSANWFPLRGVTTNSNAAAGNIGEYISQGAAGISVSAGVPADVCSISLTAGDWDVWGTIGTSPAGTTLTSLFAGWISTTSATAPSAPNNGAYFTVMPPSVAGNQSILPTGMTRLSLASTTTVYLSAQVNFTTSTCTIFGFIGARRVR
jgi:hypothetical protein